MYIELELSLIKIRLCLLFLFRKNAIFYYKENLETYILNYLKLHIFIKSLSCIYDI